MFHDSEIDGYESDDSEYFIQLWDYVRRKLTFDEALELVKGNGRGINEDGIEALEMFHLQYGLVGSDDRPPTGSVLSFGNLIYRRLKDMPPRLAVRAWRGEFEHYRYAESKQEIFFRVEMLEVAENMFDVDLRDEIVEAIERLPECESKLDMLEKHEAIDGEEWAERTDALDATEA